MQTLRLYWIFALIALVGLAACKDTSLNEVYAEPEIPHALLGENVIPKSYRIEMIINPDDEGYSGVAEIDVTINKPTQQIWMHGKNMTVENAVAVNGDTSTPITFQELAASDAPSGVAKVTSETVLAAGDYTLRLPFETPFNLNLNSAYKVVRGDDAYVVTQFEPLGAREAFPSFDEPRFKVPFTISITAPDEDFVYANTPEVSQKSDVAGWTRYDFAETLPLPTYLIAFGVGPYEVVDYADLLATEVRDRPIKLRGIAAKGQGQRFDYALENTAGIMEAIENYFGIPYPYEKLDLIAAPDYAFGAMENPGAIVYREYLLLLDENAPLSQKRAYAGVHSHELAHQWFGNLVTPYWWEDIWLNEAFATWMGNKGTSLWQPDGNFDRNTLRSALGTMNLDSLKSTRQIREPLKRSENVMQQFDSITYRKGGGVLSMFESYLGEETFRKGVQLHMERFEHDVATADDFFQSLADGSKNPDVVSAMKSFVDQPGLPLVRVGFECGEGTTQETNLPLEQSRYAPLGSNIAQGQSWEIPVCMAVISENGNREKSCTLLKEKKKAKNLIEEVHANNCPVIMPNENGAGYYRFTMPSENWADLLDNIDKLNTREVLATQDSLLAAYRAGEVESSVYLKGVEAFAKHPEYDVVSKAGDLLGFMDSQLPEAAKDDYARFVRDIYGKRLSKILGTDTLEGQLLAPTLLGNMIYRAEDKKLSQSFAEKGARYLGLDGAPDKSAVASNLLGYALRAVMEVREDEAFDPMLEIVKSGSPLEKGSALGAISSVDDPARVDKLLAMAMDTEGPFSGRQSTSIVFGLMGRRAHRDKVWTWFKTNFDDYVEKRIPDVRRPGMPSYASGLCSKEGRDEAEAFFESKAELIPGYERRLAQTLESIELCTALKSNKIEELAQALAER